VPARRQQLDCVQLRSVPARACTCTWTSSSQIPEARSQKPEYHTAAQGLRYKRASCSQPANMIVSLAARVCRGREFGNTYTCAGGCHPPTVTQLQLSSLCSVLKKSHTATAAGSRLQASQQDLHTRKACNTILSTAAHLIQQVCANHLTPCGTPAHGVVHTAGTGANSCVASAMYQDT
jgi:hypothetical protein